MMKFAELRREAYEANMEIEKQKLAIYTFGNASAFDPEAGIFAIKPSGVPYAELSPQAMVLVDLGGKVVEGDLRPSSDTPTHAVLYREFSGVLGITHTHSPYGVAWAQACEAVPIYGTTHADHLTEDIPCTEVMRDEAIRNNYEIETGNQIVQAFRGLNPLEIEMVLVACHGPFAWGKSAWKSVYNAAVLEEIAKMAWLTRTLRPGTPRLKESLKRKHYDRKHGKDAYYGQA
nr:L-ribulose-5-phosphate 4-epimerase AraD [Marispirochaeta aestuarii]